MSGPEPSKPARSSAWQYAGAIAVALVGLVLPIGIAACAVLLPFLNSSKEAVFNGTALRVSTVVVNAFYVWPVYLLTPIISSRHRLRTLLIWWAALFLCWLFGGQMSMPILIPNPYNLILFFFSLEAVFAVWILCRRCFPET